MAVAVRLQRFLAQAGVAARRKAERLMVEGRVTVNGEVANVLGTRINPDRDQVQVDGRPVYPEESFYLVLNKPKGCLTTVSDDRGRRTVMEYLTGLPASVVPVGRLDFNSEGVLLLTNDGDLSQALQSPLSHAEKTYHVKVRGQLSEHALRTLRDGVRIGPRTVTRPAVVDKLRSESKHQWIVITLTEGKSRQIHRMMEALGHQVIKLQRVAFAGISFHGLRVGDARELTQAEVNQLYSAVNMPRGAKAVSRGKWSVERETTELDRRAKQRERDAKAAAETLLEKENPAPKRTFGPRGKVRVGGFVPRSTKRPGNKQTGRRAGAANREGRGRSSFGVRGAGASQANGKGSRQRTRTRNTK